jgi:hypothetical protein
VAWARFYIDPAFDYDGGTFFDDDGRVFFYDYGGIGGIAFLLFVDFVADECAGDCADRAADGCARGGSAMRVVSNNGASARAGGSA